MTSPATTLQRGDFQNEPFTDFTKPENCKAMEYALRQVRGMFGSEYPLVIGGEKITTVDKIESRNPSNPKEVIGIFQTATREMANQAVEVAHGAFDRWKNSESAFACSANVT